jgi:hypothetical protein
MPNWCYNYVCVTHNDPAKIAELAKTLETNRTFEHFIPYPNGEWDYEFCVNNWGTKWDICRPEIHDRNAQMLDLYFETAWSPPVKVFEAMKEQGYIIQAEYWEEGGLFVGKWEDGEDRCFGTDEAPDDLSHLVAHTAPDLIEYGDETTATDAEIDAQAATHEAMTNAQ